MERIYTSRSANEKLAIRLVAGAALGFALARLFRTSLLTQKISAAIGGATLIVLPDVLSKPQPTVPLKECTPKYLQYFASVIYRSQQGNTVFSPISIWFLVLQLKKGAASHIQATLTERGIEEFAQVKNLLLYLQNDGLNIANLCLHKHPLQQNFKQYVDTFSPEYGDLNKAPSEEVKRVNTWVSKKTGGLIPTILEPDEITPQTAAILANAVAFDGKWRSRFTETEQETFTLEGNEGQQFVPMMKQTDNFYYWKDAKFRYLKVSYEGEAFSRVFIMSTVDDKDLKEALDQNLQPPDGLAKTKVEFWLPKNKQEQEINVLDLLNQMGSGGKIGTLLKKDNSLPKMVDTRDPVSLSLCRHKATIEDDEKGTKATAVTVAKVAQSISDPISFHCNRPYAYVILHEKSQLPVFVGRVTKVNVER